MNLYKEYVKEYSDAGYSVIPDKYAQKIPAISKWSDYCDRLPTSEEQAQWVENIKKTNIALCLGEASGIVALDFDCEDIEIINIIEGYLPDSPVEKVGAKGWTRFFRYTDETSNVLKFNGKVVVEILAGGKKTTIPPSKHPCGESYKWGDISLLDIDKTQLPVLPANLLQCLDQELRMRFGDAESQGRKVVSGRNDALSKYCSSLIADSVPLDEALKLLIQFDEENHKPPLFDDIDEMHHTEKFSNALAFYSNHLNSFNKKSYKKNKAYEIPITAHVIDHEVAKEVRSKKSQSEAPSKKSSPEFPKATGVLAAIQNVITTNAHKPQPLFSASASLLIVSTLAGRNFQFEGNSPNLYILNIVESGMGKDAPQKAIREIFATLKLDDLVRAVPASDAALMDDIASNPTQLIIIDECSGFFGGMGTHSHRFGMDDSMAELGTCGTSIFPGRSLKDGTRGRTIRPQLNTLASTTMSGFQQGITPTAFSKGLMGRFIIFKGDAFVRGRRIKKKDKITLDAENVSRLRHLFEYEPPLSGVWLGGFEQKYLDMRQTPEANSLLEEVHSSTEDLVEKYTKDNPRETSLPMLKRRFQLILKIAMVHAISRKEYNKDPIVDVIDVEYAQKLIEYFHYHIQEIVKNNIFSSKNQKHKLDVLNAILEKGENGITKTNLSDIVGHISPKERGAILSELLEEERIVSERRKINGSRKASLIYVGGKYVKKWDQ